MIVRSSPLPSSLSKLLSSSLLCKNFNLANYSKSRKGINTKLGTLAHHDKVQQGKAMDITLKAIILELWHFLTKPLSTTMCPDRRALEPHAVLLFYNLFRSVIFALSSWDTWTSSLRDSEWIWLCKSYVPQVDMRNTTLDSPLHKHMGVLNDWEKLLKILRYCLPIKSLSLWINLRYKFAVLRKTLFGSKLNSKIFLVKSP